MNVKRFITLFLALVMITPLIACSEAASEPDTPGNDTTAAENVTEEETVAEKTSADMIKELYGDEDYGGDDFRILSIDVNKHFYTQVSNDINEIYAEEYTGDIMNDAIYDRNKQTEELLNINIVPVWGGDTGDISTKLKTAVTSGSDDFDAVLNRMDYLGSSMQSGLLANLKSISTVDVTHPWWDANIVDNFTLFDTKLFWISGDFNTFDDYAVEVIFFNKQLCDDNSLEYPYNSVLDGTWTIDKFCGMAKAAEKDLNGDGKLTVGRDIVGHQENNDHIKHWIYAMGEKSIEINDDGTLEIMTLTERQINAVDKLYSCMVEQEMTYTGEINTFASGLALFQGIMLGNINNLREMENDFGIVPMPKYDEGQERYGEYISNGWTTAIAIPLTASKRDFTGVCLETMSAYSTATVRNALYDVMLTAKLIRDQETIQMLDIILASKTYDWAVDFSWGGTFMGAYNGVYNNKSNNYVSAAEKALKAQNKLIEKLVTTVTELQD